MENFLVVVDMQNDFIQGALGTKEALAILDNVVEKINSFQGTIFATYDTHFENYVETSEGKKLPIPHCIKGTEGWQLNKRVQKALEKKGYIKVEKSAFGSVELPMLIKKEARGQDFQVLLIGLCTDICVVSNALILKAHFPDEEISVASDCCAGVNPETHKSALEIMKCCQINIL